MRILLDTHVFLWFIAGDSRLPKRYEQSIRDSANEVFLSVASVWEATIKYQIGKLPLPQAAHIYLPAQRTAHAVGSLPLDEASITHLASLPSLHRDPFDRILICQALQHRMSIATLDDAIRAYPVLILP